MLPSQAIKFARALREHQASALDRFAYHPEMGLFWEMGTGKTTAAIAWLRAKFNIKKEITRTLIVSPVATLYNWLDEFKINAPEKVVESCLVPYMKTKKTRYTGAERAKLIAESGKQIIIVNPEVLDMKEVVIALQKFTPENVIIDEAHRFKSHSSQRFKNLLSITDKALNRAVLTGTPILNSYMDLWAQFRILDRGETFGLNFFSYREIYFQDKNIAWKGKPKYFPMYVPKKGIEQQLSEKVSMKASRLRKQDCLDLPPLIYKTHYVEMSPEQMKAYTEMEEELVTTLREGTCAAPNALSRVLRMLQILSGYLPVEADMPEKIPIHFKENPRLTELKGLLEELTPYHKVIVWCTFTENYTAIKKVCDELSLETAELTGKTKDRQAEIDRFQKTETCRVMISNPQAGGVGINLTAASYAIYYSRNFSLGDRLQSEARNHRGGSEIHKSIVLIDLVAKDTLDETVLAALLRKEQFSDNILERLRGKYAGGIS